MLFVEEIKRALRLHAEDDYTLEQLGKEPVTFVIKARAVTDVGYSELLEAMRLKHIVVQHHYDRPAGILLAVIREK